MNNIAFKTSLIKGATGTGVDKTIPEDGVIYYDGETAPEGYEQTTDPTGGGGGSTATRELIGDYAITSTQTNLTTTKDMSQYDLLEIEWVQTGNRWQGGDWANEHIMFARYKTAEIKSASDKSGAFYSSAYPISISNFQGSAIKFTDETTITVLGFSNARIARVWGIKFDTPSSGGSSYTETELFTSSGVDTGDMSLDGDIFDYDAFIFEVNDPENEQSHITLNASAFTQGTSCNIGGVSKAGAFYFQLEMQDSGTIAINNCTNGFKIYTITGVKY